jgi:hypothetical protein
VLSAVNGAHLFGLVRCATIGIVADHFEAGEPGGADGHAERAAN